MTLTPHSFLQKAPFFGILRGDEAYDRGDGRGPESVSTFPSAQSVVCPQIHASFDRKGIDRGEVAFAGAVPSEAKVQADSVLYRREMLAACDDARST